MTTKIPHIKNEYGQFVGQPLVNWQLARLPSMKTLIGLYSLLEPVNSQRHGKNLFEFFQRDPSGWTYLPYGPFANLAEFNHLLTTFANANDLFIYAILDNKSGMPLGHAGYLRASPANGSIEIGHVHFSKHLRQSRIATEAMYLLLQHAFEELGYRRCEWKCDSLNHPSQKAAQRLGYKLEGIFRQDRIYKGRSRDTVWFSIIDEEWPLLKKRFQTWLKLDNFNEHGTQKKRLSDIVVL